MYTSGVAVARPHPALWGPVIMHGLHMFVTPGRVSEGGIASFKEASIGSCAGTTAIWSV